MNTESLGWAVIVVTLLNTAMDQLVASVIGPDAQLSTLIVVIIGAVMVLRFQSVSEEN